MARQRVPPQRFSRSPRRPQRVGKRRNAKNPHAFLSPSKHKKGPVNDKPSLVRANLQKALAKKPIVIPLTDSDDSDGLVTKRKNAGKLPNQIYASGAIAQGDTPGAHPSRKRKSMDDAAEGASAEKRRQTSQGSGLKRPLKSSLRSSLAPIASNMSATSPPADTPLSSPALAASLLSSILRPNHNSSILPAAETSIIGTLKPRKRQPSILQIIQTNDSSHLTADDENEFLPDDQSTPLPVSKAIGVTSTPGSSLRRPNKDKLSSSGLRRSNPTSKQKGTITDLSVIDDAPPSSPPSLPELPQIDATKQHVTPSSEDDSVMAPPASSSPAAGTLKSISNRKAKKIVEWPTSTTAPHDQLSSRTRRTKRQRKQPPSEFDIPEDSQGSQGQLGRATGESDNTPFKQQRRKTAGQVRKTSTVAPAKPPTRNKRGASVLSDATNRSKNVRGAASKGRGSAKQSGGARHLGTTSTARGRGADKENTLLPGGTAEDLDELQRIRHKFTEIDGWDMEFEDVDVDERSSELDMR